jgi:CheY-like chemotaxis protein
MKIWFVDDRRENHTTWECSFPESIRVACELRAFETVGELIDQLVVGELPDILFVDFFIGERLGTEVIRWFENQEARPILIAHSSMQAANEGMVREGADFYLEKIKYRPYTESIRTAFPALEDVAYLIEHRILRSMSH